MSASVPPKSNVPPINSEVHFPTFGQTEEVTKAMESGESLEVAVYKNKKTLRVTREDGGNLGAILPTKILKAFEVAGNVVIKRLKDGALEIITKTAEEAKRACAVKMIGDVKIRVQQDAKKNICKAIVHDKDMKFWDLEDEELWEKLKKQGVSKIDPIMIRKKSTQPKSKEATGEDQTDADSQRDAGKEVEKEHTNLFIITFDLPVRPMFVEIGYVILETRDYIPDPLRCFNCHTFGHTSGSCRNKPICPRCAGPAHQDQICAGKKKCINCSGEHSAAWRKCPTFQKEMAIQKVKVTYKMTFDAARKYVSQWISNQKNLADIVKSKPNNACSGSCCDRCRQHGQKTKISSTDHPVEPEKIPSAANPQLNENQETNEDPQNAGDTQEEQIPNDSAALSHRNNTSSILPMEMEELSPDVVKYHQSLFQKSPEAVKFQIEEDHEPMCSSSESEISKPPPLTTAQKRQRKKENRLKVIRGVDAGSIPPPTKLRARNIADSAKQFLKDAENSASANGKNGMSKSKVNK